MNEKFSMTTQMFLNELKSKSEQPVAAPHRAPGSSRPGKTLRPKLRRLIASPDTVGGTVYISCFIHLNEVSNLSEVQALGVEIEETFDDLGFVTARVPVDQLDALAAVDNVKKIKVAQQMRPSTNVARQQTNVDDLLTNSAEARAMGVSDVYDGTGVVLGVIDTGIDFQHIAFKDKNGNSRIKRAYVYNGSSAQEYTSITSSAPTTDDTSEDHGTHTATTAGGSSVTVSGSTVTVTDDHANATYGGIAPGADLYLAGINGLSDTYLSNALKKMVTYADGVGKPLVVSNSWGSGWGPRTGTGDWADLVAQYFGDSHPNHVILFAASNDAGHKNGNEGGGYFVKKSGASSTSPLGTIIRTDGEGGNGYYGLVACAWNNTNSTKLNCKIHVLNNSTGAVIKSWTVTTNGTSTFSGLSDYYSGSMIVYIEQENSRYRLALYTEDGIETKSSGAYTLAIEVYPTNGSANINMWSGDWNFFTNHLTTSEHTWTAGTDDMCVSDEATIPDAISIGAYVSKKSWKASNGSTYTSNVYTVGDIAYFSSYATAEQSPTGVAYPWISAPGARLAAGVNHYHTASVDSYSYYHTDNKSDLVVNSSTSPYAMMEGTSMATPVAAGIVALWLQAANSVGKTLTVNEVKDIMEQTAITDSYTSGANASHFGKGKIDALAGIQYILNTVTSPLIRVTPASIDFAEDNPYATRSYTKTLNVKGMNLEDGITATLTDANGVYSLSQTSITQSAATASGGVDITITYSPQSAGTHTASITLSSTGATDVVVPLTATAQAATPIIVADPETLSFKAGLNTAKSLTVDVLTEFLTGNVAVTLSDANGVFTVDKTSITKAESEEGATLTVTFLSATAGTFNGTVTLSSPGAESVVISLTGKATDSASNPNTTKFKRVTSIDDLEEGMRYIIGCGSKATAAGALSSSYLNKVDITLSNDIITASSGVAVFVLEGNQTDGWTFKNESTSQYLQCAAAKSVSYTTTPYNWTLSNGTAGVIMTADSNGTMLYNSGSPRFTTYTSSPNASMIQANLYMEYDDGTTATPSITTDKDALAFSTTVGTPQTLTVEVQSENLTQDITATLTDANNVFSLGTTTISRTASASGTTLNVTFTPTAAGTFSGTLTLSSAGADPVTVSLSATATAPSTLNPVIVADESKTFSTTVGTPQTLTIEILSEDLTEDITATLTDAAGVFSLGTTTISRTDAAEGTTLSVTFTPTAAGTYTGTVTLSSAGAEPVTVSLSATATASGSTTPSNDFTLITSANEFEEGDYIIVYGGVAMNTTVSSNRLQYTEVTPVNNVITTSNDAIIWHIAPSGSYYTIYNEGAGKYAASNGTKNQAQLLASGTDDKSLWSVSTEATFDFTNKYNAAKSVNATLRRNGTYGFACYATGTGGPLSLYKRNPPVAEEDTPANPVFGVTTGTYAPTQSFTLSCATANAKIYYTTDDTTPSNSNGTLYSNGFTLPTVGTYTVKAIAYSQRETKQSNVVSCPYTIEEETPAAPTFSPAAGTYITEQNVTLSCATTGASVHYTLDGTTPTASSPIYSSAIALDESGTYTIKAIAVSEQGTKTSAVVTATYVLNLPVKPNAPRFSLDGGTYTTPQSIQIVADEGCTIKYVMSASSTATPATAYTQALELTTEGTFYLRAVAVKDGVESTIAEDTYTYTPAASESSDVYKLVTSTDQLVTGKKYVIAATNSGTTYALSTTQGSNNRSATEVTKSGNTITATSDTQVLTLGGDATDGWSFYTGSGYLYAASSSKNYLKTQTTNDDNGLATISVTNAGVASITFQGSNTRNQLKFNPNNGNPIFSCYASDQTSVSLYVQQETSAEPKASDIDDGIYRIKDAVGYLCVNPDGTLSKTTDPSNLGTIFTAIKQTDGTYRIQAQDRTIATANGSTVTLSEDATISLYHGTNNEYISLGNDKYVNADVLAGNVGAEWTFAAVATTDTNLPTIDLSTPTTGSASSDCTYRTFYADFPLTLNEGRAYTITLSGHVATANPINGTIPAGTPVLIVTGEDDDDSATSISIIPQLNDLDLAGFSDEENVLRGTCLPIATASIAGNVYVFSQREGVPGFYRYNGTTLGANKAYLVLGAAAANPSSFSIQFPDDETTGVEVIPTADGDTNTYYDLSGR
ncbi:MAG: chitobiase/beta-hexosaminidase C-terminal domain-containing protein, partial [Alloprevotella sp.]|nr:chitobiase/beta-hexosaminidase C-terminal domain-containing protein [Alloprevotella sp.]